MMTSTVSDSTMQAIVNSFLVGMGIGTLLTMIVKPREPAVARKKVREKADLASRESFPASEAPGY